MEGPLYILVQESTNSFFAQTFLEECESPKGPKVNQQDSVKESTDEVMEDMANQLLLALVRNRAVSLSVGIASHTNPGGQASQGQLSHADVHLN